MVMYVRILGSEKVCNRVDLIDVALGAKPADVVIQSGSLVNVHTSEIYNADIAIKGGRIVAVGDVAYTVGNKTKIINAEGKYLIPGLIDAHLHFYHSYIGLTEFAKAILLHGTTTYADGFYGPAVVSGRKAIEFLRQELLKTPLKCIFLVPVLGYSQCREYSLSPTPTGLTAEEMVDMTRWDDCLGLEEPSPLPVIEKEHAHVKAYESILRSGKVITGHAIDLWSGYSITAGRQLTAYLVMGSLTDHECVSVEEAVEKARLGMRILARMGPGWAENIPELVKAITKRHIDPRCFAFCTDALPPDALAAGVAMDECIRVAIREGIEPIQAVQMATLNVAELFRVDEEIGSITPGRIADILFITDLQKFKISMVMANGEIVVNDGKFVVKMDKPKYPEWMYKTVQLKRPVKPEDFEIKAPKEKKEVLVRVMYYPTNSIIITEKRMVLSVKDGYVKPNIEEDVIKVAMVDRFGRGNVGNAFIQGLGLRKGAFGTTVNATQQNIIVAGTNSYDMAFVVNKLAEIGGGMLVAADGKELAVLELPLFGLLSDQSLEIFVHKNRRLFQELLKLGWKRPSTNALDWLGPASGTTRFRISDLGLLDTESRRIVDVVLQ
jgi:adenine deaminase